MDYFLSDLQDNIPPTLTTVRPKLLSSGGSGYPWHLLGEERETGLLALMLSDIDCFEAVIGDEDQECWSS